ncbi:hypothetical protein QYE76_008631 [Lolium multiflorum]|uniref:DUF4218 domain-containing protein n=1 Tax=Lolium multiflorum TaxID=4521 RepID=A0AAD8TTB0_LOLMU|nr:hypothetical protein QYE76_008631 [Lolium multiflorum]
MKRKYIQMSMLIQGPTQPGNDINMYLELLKEELETLWAEEGVDTWDAVAEEYFPLRAALITTVQDYLGYGYISCQVCHGHKACVRCMEETMFLQLGKDPGSSKTVYMGHRRWLQKTDPWRKRGDLFDGTNEPRGPPRKKSGEEIDTLLKGWKECPAPGKIRQKPGEKKKKKETTPLIGVWKRRSVFWDLPWKILDTPHCLDVMHITKNVCESLLGTLLNMPDRTKDGPKARHDLKVLGIGEELQIPPAQEGQSEEEADGGQKRKRIKQPDYYCPPSCFTFSPAEVDQFFNCLVGVRVPFGYSGLISRYMDPKKRNFSGMKSHDCHVMMTQILPVAIRGIMDDHVRATLTGLCNFFDVITRKSISVKKLARLQEEIVVILCEMEMYFPPAFFDVMVHLLVHIMDDIVSLGLAFLHNMMPFERMNGVIKGYVRNRSHPDGSIVQGWLTEECISFCTNYLDIEDPVGLPQNKHLCRWAKSVTKEDRYFTTMFLPEANKSKSTNATAQNEPWVLAEHVHQCFFITDPSRPSRVIVRRGKRTIVGMDGVANEEDFEGQHRRAVVDLSARPCAVVDLAARRSRRARRSRASPRRGGGGRHAPATVATVDERRRRPLRAGHRRGEEQQGVATIAVVQATMSSQEELEEHYNRHFFRTEEDAEAAGVGGDEDHEMEDAAGGSADEAATRQAPPPGVVPTSLAAMRQPAPPGVAARQAATILAAPPGVVAPGQVEPRGRGRQGAKTRSAPVETQSQRWTPPVVCRWSLRMLPRVRQPTACILREVVNLNETDLRAESKAPLRAQLIARLHARYKFLGDYASSHQTNNIVNSQALLKFTKHLSSYKYMVRKLIAEGKGFEEVHSAFPHVTQADFDAFVANEELQATKNRKLWGMEMRDLNIGNHNLGSRGYEGKEPYWAKEDEAYVNAGIENPWLKYKDPLERRFIRSRYHKKKLTGELVTDPKVVTDIIWFTNDQKEEERQRLSQGSQGDEGSSSQASTGRVAWDKPLLHSYLKSKLKSPLESKQISTLYKRGMRVANKAPPKMQVVSFNGSNSMVPPSAGNDNVIMETPPAAGNVAGARDSPSMPGSSPSVTCTPAAACAGPSTLAELNALTPVESGLTEGLGTAMAEDPNSDQHLLGVDGKQRQAPCGATCQRPSTTASGAVVIAPPERPAAPEVSAPPQQPAAPEAEEYERDNFQWDIPTSSQVVHEDAPGLKYVCSKKLFDSQETADEEENPKEVATAAIKNMLSPNTLRATATTAMDGPALQPKKRKRANKKDAQDKAAAKSKDKVPLLDKLPNNWRPLHHLGQPMLPEHVVKKLTPDMRSLHETVLHVENLLLKSKDPGYPLFMAKVPTGMNFVEKYPADLCFIRFNDIFSIYRMQALHFSVVRLVALSLSSQIVKEGTPTIAIMDPFYMRESIICNPGDRAIATQQVKDFMLANIKKGAILIPYFPEQSTPDNGMDAWYAILQMQEYIKYADDMLLPENLRNRSGEFFYGYGLPPNDEIDLRLEMSRDERPFNSLEGCRPFPLGVQPDPTTGTLAKA